MNGDDEKFCKKCTPHFKEFKKKSNDALHNLSRKILFNDEILTAYAQKRSEEGMAPLSPSESEEDSEPELQELTGKIEKLQAENEAYKKKCTDNQIQINAVYSVLKDKEKENEEISKLLDKEKDHSKQINSEKLRAESDCRAYKKRMNYLEKEKWELQEKENHLRSEIENLKNALMSKQQQYEELTQIFAKDKETMKEKEIALNERSEENALLTSNLQKLNQEYAKLQKDFNDASFKQSYFEKEVLHKQCLIHHLEKELKNEKKAKEDLIKTLERKDHQLQEETTKSQNLLNQYNDLESKHSSCHAKITHLQDQLNEKKSTCKSLEQRILLQQQTSKDRDTSILKLESNLVEENKKREIIEKEKSLLEDQLQESCNRANQLERSLSQVQAKLVKREQESTENVERMIASLKETYQTEIKKLKITGSMQAQELKKLKGIVKRQDRQIKNYNLFLEKEENQETEGTQAKRQKVSECPSPSLTIKKECEMEQKAQPSLLVGSTPLLLDPSNSQCLVDTTLIPDTFKVFIKLNSDAWLIPQVTHLVLEFNVAERKIYLSLCLSSLPTLAFVPYQEIGLEIDQLPRLETEALPSACQSEETFEKPSKKIMFTSLSQKEKRYFECLEIGDKEKSQSLDHHLLNFLCNLLDDTKKEDNDYHENLVVSYVLSRPRVNGSHSDFSSLVGAFLHFFTLLPPSTDVEEILNDRKTGKLYLSLIETRIVNILSRIALKQKPHLRHFVEGFIAAGISYIQKSNDKNLYVKTSILRVCMFLSFLANDKATAYQIVRRMTTVEPPSLASKLFVSAVAIWPDLFNFKELAQMMAIVGIFPCCAASRREEGGILEKLHDYTEKLHGSLTFQETEEPGCSIEVVLIKLCELLSCTASSQPGLTSLIREICEDRIRELHWSVLKLVILPHVVAPRVELCLANEGYGPPVQALLLLSRAILASCPWYEKSLMREQVALWTSRLSTMAGFINASLQEEFQYLLALFPKEEPPSPLV